LAAEAEFYGAMDGASRFTQRDAIASIIITAINIIAGISDRSSAARDGLTRALQTYTILTIGDGLVTVIPALMISVSGGLIVTRASSDAKLGADVKAQMFSNPQPLLLASGVLMAMAAFPGLPKIPFILIGATLGTVAWRMRQKMAAVEQGPKEGAAAEGERGVAAAGGADRGGGGVGTGAVCGRRAEFTAA
jgi:flagellar biosynthesis protein FlhA